MDPVKIPKGDKKLEDFFRTILPENESIQTKPMFGNLAAFVNGNLFSGLYGETLFVRLSEEDRKHLLKVKGTRLFEPMKGRPMKEYVCVPDEWRSDRSIVSPWISKALEWTGRLPAKEMKRKIAKK